MTARTDGAAGRGRAATPQRGDNGTVWPFQQCVECGRTFNLFFEEDAEEWAYGHDCEDQG